MARDRGIQVVLALRVDVLGAADDDVDHPVIDLPGGENLGHRRQLITQHPRQMNLVTRPAPADVLGRRNLGRHFLERISTPKPTLRQLHRAQPIQLTHRRQPPRDRHRLRTRSLTDLIDQHRRTPILEHVFDTTAKVRA